MSLNRVLHGDPSWLSAQPDETSPGAPSRASRVNLDAENVDRGLARLVLAVMELVRQLLERQAIRRVEGGSLTDVEVERLGQTLQALERRLGELRNEFGLRQADIDLPIGPTDELLYGRPEVNQAREK